MRLTLQDASTFFGIVCDGRAEVEVAEQCIVDDVKHPVAVPAERLDSVLARVSGIVCDAYRCHGLTLNFAPSKTAAVVTYAGPGCKAVRERCENRGDIQFITHGFAKQLPLAWQYKHVGVQFARGMTLWA